METATEVGAVGAVWEMCSESFSQGGVTLRCVRLFCIKCRCSISCSVFSSKIPFIQSKLYSLLGCTADSLNIQIYTKKMINFTVF